MKLVVAGTRSFKDYLLLSNILKNYTPSLIITGCSEYDITLMHEGKKLSADLLAVKYAQENSIPTLLFPADWEKYDRYAGIHRNKQMADYADEGVVFWDGVSSGSRNMINEMKRRDKRVKIVPYKEGRLDFV